MPSTALPLPAACPHPALPWPAPHAGCALVQEGVPVAAAVDGTDGSSWRLPLPPLSATSLPEPYR